MRQLLLVTALCSIASTAYAGETLKFRTIVHPTDVKVQEIGDVPDHTVNLLRSEGLATFPDGSVALVYFIAVNDYIKGSGQIPLVYYNVTFPDGSALWLKNSAEAKFNGARTDIINGHVEVISGKGRFAGMKGEGTVTGARVSGPLHVGAGVYNDLVINLR
jgi:hypothetical protein